ncbi:MAG: hypothetical protein HZA90_14770 [Verrucomicrobia bacterium]|nr:hypothetical protein [Verrucomicrobiota bacterium]
MKTTSLILLGLLSLGPGAQAQTYVSDWFTLDGGGGTSSNSQYSVSGTLGQPDTGTMSGGQFTLHGGFWGILAAVPTPGAPLLTVTRTTTNTVVVSWPGPEAGWKLHWTESLSTTPILCTEIAPPYATSATNLCFVEPVPVGHRFYRLHKP